MSDTLTIPNDSLPLALREKDDFYSVDRRRQEGHRELKECRDLHKQINRMKATGMTNVSVAAALGISESTVSVAINSLVCKEHLGQLHDEADERVAAFASNLDECQDEALQLLKDVATGKIKDEDNKPPPLALRMKASESLLDRGGNGAVRKVENFSTIIQYTHEELIQIKEEARGEAIKQGMIAEPGQERQDGKTQGNNQDGNHENQEEVDQDNHQEG